MEQFHDLYGLIFSRYAFDDKTGHLGPGKIFKVLSQNVARNLVRRP